MSSYDLDQADRFCNVLETQIQRAAVKGLRSAGLRCVQVIVTQIIPGKTPQPVDRGVYRAGWRSVPLPDGATVENLEPVAILIEEGVRAENVKPGRKMIDALAEWAVRKGFASAGPEARSAAFAIAKSMQRRGIFGQAGMNILGELIEKYADRICEEEIEREIGRVNL